MASCRLADLRCARSRDGSAGPGLLYNLSAAIVQPGSCRPPAAFLAALSRARAAGQPDPGRRSARSGPPLRHVPATVRSARGRPGASLRQADGGSWVTIEADWRVALFHAGLTLGDGGD